MSTLSPVNATSKLAPPLSSAAKQLATGVAAPQPAQQPTDRAPDKTAAQTQAPSSLPVTVVDILHVNDLHESYTRWPQLVTAFDTLSHWSQQQGHTTLRFDTGDNLIGTEPADLPVITQLMNRMGLDGAVPGNHDFDLGARGLATMVAGSHFPWLGTNLYTPQKSSLGQLEPTQTEDDASKTSQSPVATTPLTNGWVVDSAIINRQGLKIGLLGVTTPNLLSLLSPSTELEGIHPDDFKQTAARVQEQITTLEQQGIHQIILLSHLGYAADKALIDPDKGKVHGIDVIVGGHSHDALHGIQPEKTLFHDTLGNPVLVVQTGKNGHNVGLTEVAFDEQGHVQPLRADLLPTQSFAPDESTRQFLTGYLGPERPLANLSQPYDDRGIASTDDAMANFAADELARRSGADIALVSAADIKQGAQAGPITNWHVREMIPFQSPYYVADVTGSQLLDTFDQLARAQQQHESHPSLLHPSANLHVTLDAKTGKAAVAGLYSPQWKTWVPIDPRQHYPVALSDFALGSSEYPALKGAPVVAPVPGNLRDWMAQAFYQAQGARPNQPIALASDGRLTITGA